MLPCAEGGRGQHGNKRLCAEGSQRACLHSPSIQYKAQSDPDLCLRPAVYQRWQRSLPAQSFLQFTSDAGSAPPLTHLQVLTLRRPQAAQPLGRVASPHFPAGHHGVLLQVGARCYDGEGLHLHVGEPADCADI